MSIDLNARINTRGQENTIANLKNEIRDLN